MNRDTICVQGGYTPGNGEPRQIPIIQSTTFKYATSEDMGKLFDLEADGYFSHHVPSFELMAPEFKGSPLNGAFTVELGGFIADSPIEYWIYGKTEFPP